MKRISAEFGDMGQNCVEICGTRITLASLHTVTASVHFTYNWGKPKQLLFSIPFPLIRISSSFELHLSLRDFLRQSIMEVLSGSGAEYKVTDPLIITKEMSFELLRLCLTL